MQAIIKRNIYVSDNDATRGFWGNELEDCPYYYTAYRVCYLPHGGTVATVTTVFSTASK